MATFELTVAADIARYQKDFAKIPGFTEKQAAKAAEKQVREMNKAATKSANASKKAAKTASAAWSKAFAAVGAVSFAGILASTVQVARKIGDLTVEVIDLRNELTDMATRTGLTAETLQGLKLAAEASGQEFSAIVGVARKIPKLMSDVEGGSKKAALGFSNLGVELRDSNGEMKTSDAVFRDLVKSIGSIEDPTVRATKVAGLLGKAGGDLLVAIGGGAEAFAAFDSFARSYGTDTGPAAAAAAARMQVEFAAFDVVTTGAKDALASFIIESGNLKFVASTIVATMTTLRTQTTLVQTAFNDLGAGFARLSKAEGLGAISDALLDIGKASADALAGGLAGDVNKSRDAVDKFNSQWDRMFESSADGASTPGSPTNPETSKTVAKSAAAMKSLGAITASAVTSQLSEEAKLDATLQARLDRIVELSGVIEEGTARDLAIQAAANAVFAQNEGERTALTAKRIAEQQKLEDAANKRRLSDFAAQLAEEKALTTAKIGNAISAAQILGQVAELSAGQDKKARRRSWFIARASAIAQAGLNTALAISNALGTIPPPANVPAAVLAGVAGGVATAAVAAKPGPSFFEGTRGLSTTFADPKGTTASFHPGERVKVENRRDVQQSRGGNRFHLETFIGARQISDSMADEVNRGGDLDAAITRKAGRLGRTARFRSV